MATDAGERFITVKEFLHTLTGRLSKNTAYEQIAAGTIPSVRIGRRILVPSDALDRMLDAKTDGGHQQEPPFIQRSKGSQGHRPVTDCAYEECDCECHAA